MEKEKEKFGNSVEKMLKRCGNCVEKSGKVMEKGIKSVGKQGKFGERCEKSVRKVWKKCEKMGGGHLQKVWWKKLKSVGRVLMMCGKIMGKKTWKICNRKGKVSQSVNMF